MHGIYTHKYIQIVFDKQKFPNIVLSSAFCIIPNYYIYTCIHIHMYHTYLLHILEASNRIM